MNILYPILGFIALGIAAAIVLPIIVVIFFVGVAALVVSLGTWKLRTALSPRFRTLSVGPTASDAGTG
jgi:hypothetical protein